MYSTLFRACVAIHGYVHIYSFSLVCYFEHEQKFVTISWMLMNEIEVAFLADPYIYNTILSRDHLGDMYIMTAVSLQR